MAVAADGSVYVSGTTFVIPPLVWPFRDLLLQKYSPAGALLWTKTYNGAGNHSDEGEGVAVSADGGVYVIGTTQVPKQSNNLLLLKYQ